MIASLQRHPFPVVARFDRVVAVSFAFPEGVLRPMVPQGLAIDSYKGLGFVTVALVWTRKLRPAGFPEVFGRDFFLSGTRIFTRLEDESGRRLRGLKIIRSETDKRTMVWAGNLMTHYNYRLARVRMDEKEAETRILVKRMDGEVSLDLCFDADSPDPGLPAGSPFPDWRTARSFAGPMPFTFSPEGDGSFVVIEGSRGEWKPRPVVVKNWEVGLFRESPLCDATPILANAFVVENVDYRWEKGRIVKPGGRAG
jgi:uncharacterized protein YqjF (DUF2071 family)